MKNKYQTVLLATMFLLTAALPARATVMLDVSGPSDTPVDLNQAMAASFRLDNATSNVSISAALICSNCSFTAYLMQGNFGPSASVSDLVQAVNFNSVPLGGELFSGLNLVADDYYLVLENLSLVSVIWEGSSSPLVTTLSGVHHLEDWSSTVFDPTFAPNSLFDVILGQGARFYSITSAATDPGTGLGTDPEPNPGTVPEPNGLALFLIGAALIPLAVRRKPARAQA